MLRNVFAALAVPISYNIIKYGATASIVTYAAHLTTSLSSRSFNKPTLVTLRFSAKVVDVIGSAIYKYYFRAEIQEIGKTIGYYIEAYSPTLIDKTLTYAIQFGKNYLEPIAHYITYYGILAVTLVKDVSTDALLYTFSSRFIRDVIDFNAYLHDGLSINLYGLAEDLAYLTRSLNEWLHSGPSINLYGLAENLAYLTRNLNEWLHSDPSINLYNLFSDSLEFAKAIYNTFYEASIKFLEVFNELSNHLIDLTMVVEPIIWLYNAFSKLILTPFFDLVIGYFNIFLELCDTPVDLTSLAIYLDAFAVKFMELWNYPFDLTSEAFMQWLDEPLDLTLEQVLEQVSLYKEAFVEWLNAPSDLNEILSGIISTPIFKFIFIATGKILFEDHIKSVFLQVLLTGVIINELGEALQQTAKEVNSNIVTQNNLKAISFKPDATDSVIMTESNISTLESCFSVTNLTQTEIITQPSFTDEEPQQKTFTHIPDNNSEVSEDTYTVGGTCKNLLSSQYCDTLLCCL